MRSGRGFRQQLLDDSFNMPGLQADGADDAFAIHDRVGGIIMHLPGLGRSLFPIARDRILNALFPGVGRHFFLSPIRSTDANDEQALVFLSFEHFVVVGDGGHARAAPGCIEIHDDDLAF